MIKANYDLIKRQLRDKGWAKINVNEIGKIDLLKNQLIDGVIKNEKINSHFKAHKIFNIEDLRSNALKFNDEVINEIRKVYVDSLSEKIVDCFSESIINIFGRDILIQRYPQIQLNVANKNSTKTFPHIEVMAGHSPFTFNFWLPFHDVENKSGIYIVDSDKSVELCDYEINNKITNRLDLLKEHMYFPEVRYGEALLFNGFVYHGTVDHDVKQARISLDLRLQSSDKPLFQKFNEFFRKVKL